MGEMGCVFLCFLWSLGLEPGSPGVICNSNYRGSLRSSLLLSRPSAPPFSPPCLPSSIYFNTEHSLQ